MLNLYMNKVVPGEPFRSLIYSGAIFLYSKLDVNIGFCDYARQCIRNAFGEDQDPRLIHQSIPVEEFIRKVSGLKGEFTNSVRSKQFIRDFLVEIGQQPEEHFFDVPRIRVVPDYDYLHAGVSYAYLPHRDTWYGGPDCQINTWMPVFPIEADQTMMLNPHYFNRPVSNSSAQWDLQHWVMNERTTAQTNVTTENRPHPLPLEEIREDTELRIAGGSADMMVFSGSQLHGTVPNRSGKVRYSIDFRIYHREDLMSRKGAKNHDGAAKNIEFGFRDLYRASDFKSFPEVVK